MNKRGKKIIKKRTLINAGVFLVIFVTATAMLLCGCSFFDEDDSWTSQDESGYEDEWDTYDDDDWETSDGQEDEVVSSDVMEENPLEADEPSQTTQMEEDKPSSGSSGQESSSANDNKKKTKKKLTKVQRYKRAKKKLAYKEWKGRPYRVVNENKPYFTKKQMKKARKSYKKFGRLDSRRRCTFARASLSKKTMPKSNEERQDISFIHPSGWRSGQSWERMHLIGWALSDENANARNLITGTHYCNTVGMLPFEERINHYIRTTSNHVLYRVTPVFRGKELVARGVLMEAKSVEDKGKGICFNVYCYNVRDDGSKINYSTGYVKEKSAEGDQTRSNKERKYVLNVSSMKFHYPSCTGAKSIADHNKRTVKATRKELIKQGFKPCGLCEP